MKKCFVPNFRKLRDDESGSSTIEALIWIPIFVFFLVLILDTCFIFFGKAQALRFVQDGNRAFSVGALADTDATELFIKNAIAAYAPKATVETTIVDGIIVSTTMKVPATDLMVVGTISAFDNVIVSITATHFLEL